MGLCNAKFKNRILKLTVLITLIVALVPVAICGQDAGTVLQDMANLFSPDMETVLDNWILNQDQLIVFFEGEVQRQTALGKRIPLANLQHQKRELDRFLLSRKRRLESEYEKWERTVPKDELPVGINARRNLWFSLPETKVYMRNHMAEVLEYYSRYFSYVNDLYLELTSDVTNLPNRKMPVRAFTLMLKNGELYRRFKVEYDDYLNMAKSIDDIELWLSDTDLRLDLDHDAPIRIDKGENVSVRVKIFAGRSPISLTVRHGGGATPPKILKKEKKVETFTVPIDYDFNQPGEYKVQIEVSDSNSPKKWASRDFVITVVDPDKDSPRRKFFDAGKEVSVDKSKSNRRAFKGGWDTETSVNKPEKKRDLIAHGIRPEDPGVFKLNKNSKIARINFSAYGVYADDLTKEENLTGKATWSVRDEKGKVRKDLMSGATFTTSEGGTFTIRADFGNNKYSTVEVLVIEGTRN